MGHDLPAELASDAPAGACYKHRAIAIRWPIPSESEVHRRPAQQILDRNGANRSTLTAPEASWVNDGTICVVAPIRCAISTISFTLLGPAFGREITKSSILAFAAIAC